MDLERARGGGGGGEVSIYTTRVLASRGATSVTNRGRSDNGRSETRARKSRGFPPPPPSPSADQSSGRGQPASHPPTAVAMSGHVITSAAAHMRVSCRFIWVGDTAAAGPLPGRCGMGPRARTWSLHVTRRRRHRHPRHLSEVSAQRRTRNC